MTQHLARPARRSRFRAISYLAVALGALLVVGGTALVFLPLALILAGVVVGGVGLVQIGLRA